MLAEMVQGTMVPDLTEPMVRRMGNPLETVKVQAHSAECAMDLASVTRMAFGEMAPAHLERMACVQTAIAVLVQTEWPAITDDLAGLHLVTADTALPVSASAMTSTSITTTTVPVHTLPSPTAEQAWVLPELAV